MAVRQERVRRQPARDEVGRWRMRRADHTGQARLPLLLMIGGGVVLLAALGFVLFGRDKKVDTATLANRCAFPACRAAFDPGGGRGYEGPSVVVDPKDEN